METGTPRTGVPVRGWFVIQLSGDAALAEMRGNCRLHCAGPAFEAFHLLRRYIRVVREPHLVGRTSQCNGPRQMVLLAAWSCTQGAVSLTHVDHAGRP